MKGKFNGADNLEEVYFVSESEETLPSLETLLEEIEKCIPDNYDIVDHHAVHNRSFIDNQYIRYIIHKVDPNRYRIRVFYDITPGILGYLILIAGLFFGGSLGYHFFGNIGAFFGGIIGVIVVDLLCEDKKSVEKTCERIVNCIKEYERAHLIGLKSSESSNH